MGTDHEHRVCTYEEAERTIRAQDVIYVNDCFCRGPALAGQTSWAYCGHAIDTCMGFDRSAVDASGVEYREVTQAEALERVRAWRRQGNLVRTMEGGRWLCLCCTCGCQWFRDKQGNPVPDPCDPSPFVEETDLLACTHCGACAPVCPTGARIMTEEALLVTSEACYGCSACAYVCLESAIRMVPRGTAG